MNSSLIIVVALSFFTPLLSFGRDFTVDLQQWKTVKSNFDGTVYENPLRAEEVVITKVLTDNASKKALIGNENLTHISELRSQFLAKFGIGNYTIVEYSQKKSNVQGFSYYNEFQALYVGLDGKKTQAIERQYVLGKKIFQVVYSAPATEMNNLEHVNSVLDRFKPSAGRTPSSKDSELATSRPVSCTNCSNVSVAPDQLRISAAQSNDKCKDVPEEYRRPLNSPTEQVISEKLIGAYCGAGVSSFGTDIINMVVDSYFAIGKYKMDPEYKSQVDAAASLLYGEIKKHPLAFGHTVVVRVYNSLAKYCKDFMCYKNEIKVMKICNLVTGSVIPVGVLAKMAIGANLTAREAVSVAKLTESALADLKVVKPTKLRIVKNFGFKTNLDVDNQIKAVTSEILNFEKQALPSHMGDKQIVNFLAEKMKTEGYTLKVKNVKVDGMDIIEHKYYLEKESAPGLKPIEVEIPPEVLEREYVHTTPGEFDDAYSNNNLGEKLLQRKDISKAPNKPGESAQFQRYETKPPQAPAAQGL